MPVMFRRGGDWPLAVLAVAVLVGSIASERAGRDPQPRWTGSCVPNFTPRRFATFNIEEFPKHAAQIEGAFDELAGLDAGFVAVQEITDPAVFLAAAQRRLGPDWRFVHRDTMPEAARLPPMHVGVLYDNRELELRSVTLHHETRLDGRNKPTLEVRLSERDGTAMFRIFVVHLKAGSEGRPLRARQYQALGDILLAAGTAERIIVLGDFNATDEADRADLAQLAARTSLHWATEDLGCSAFWDRDDGCPTSRLDHVLLTDISYDVGVGGACAEGCQVRDQCPLYAEQVSDHCPVIVTVP